MAQPLAVSRVAVSNSTSLRVGAANRLSDPSDLELRAFDSDFAAIKEVFDVPALEDHLTILKTIFLMIRRVDENFVVTNPDTCHKQASPLMKLFLSKAIHRFEVWITKGLNHFAPDKALPPLDVLLILQAYLLAPRSFTEDAALRFPQLKSVGTYPSKATVRLLIALSFDCHRMLPSVAE